MSDDAQRQRRADAQRNRERVIDAATSEFCKHGLDVSVAAIARRAGVGPATLFRNFADKDELILAVSLNRLNKLCELVDRHSRDSDPARGFENLVFDAADFLANDRCALSAAKSAVGDAPELAEMIESLNDRVGRMLAAAQAARAVRDDITQEDLRFFLLAASERDAEDDHETRRRYLQIVIDGLRPSAATVLPANSLR